MLKFSHYKIILILNEKWKPKYVLLDIIEFIKLVAKSDKMLS